MTQTHTAFVGCSYTQGKGLSGTVSNENLWVNLLHNSYKPLMHTTLLNLGVSGSTNAEIFHQAINCVSNYDCRYLFVAWTSLYRYKFSLGAETYDVQQYWSAGHPLNDVNLHPGITLTKKYLTEIKDKFFSLHHDHCEILKVLNYTATINELCKKLGVNVYFVNNILPWDKDYFELVVSVNRKPADTTKYTQYLLNSDTRDDQEYFEIYDKIHNEYQQTQGLRECNWLNLYSGFKENFVIDFGIDKQHPGEQSHRQFAWHLLDSLQKNNKQLQP
jgi:hypothetical protein